MIARSHVTNGHLFAGVRGTHLPSMSELPPRSGSPAGRASASHSLSGLDGVGHALAGTLLFLSATMTGVQDVVAAMGGATGTLLAVHCGTLLMLTWTAAQITLLSEAIERRDDTLVVRRVAPADVVARIAARWWWRTPALLALHLALGWLGGGWSL